MKKIFNLGNILSLVFFLSIICMAGCVEAYNIIGAIVSILVLAICTWAMRNFYFEED